MKKKSVWIGFTQTQKTELWNCWRRGEQMKSIGQELASRLQVFSNILSRQAALRLFEASCNFMPLIQGDEDVSTLCHEFKYNLGTYQNKKFEKLKKKYLRTTSKSNTICRYT